MDARKQEEFGKMVAGTKTFLHEAEIKITDNKMDEVDWNTATEKLEALLKAIKDHQGGGKSHAAHTGHGGHHKKYG